MSDEHLAFYSYVIHYFLLILRLSPRLFLGSENNNKKQIKQNKKKSIGKRMRAEREAAVFRDDYFVDSDGKENINRFLGAYLFKNRKKQRSSVSSFLLPIHYS